MGKFVMPSLGSQMIEAKLVQWLVKPGDHVKRGDIIGEIDTEKGLIDIEVFEDGIITDLLAKEGEVIPVGSVMAIINGNGQEHAKESVGSSEKPKAVAAPKKETPVKKRDSKAQSKVLEDVSTKGGLQVKASPLAKQVARDLKVDINQVTGSGYGGTIHKKDVEAFVREQSGKETFDKEIEMAEHISAHQQQTGMRQAIAAAMSQSNREIPHYYLESEMDMKVLQARLEEVNQKRSLEERYLLPMVFVKAVAQSLSEVPALNGYWMDGELQIKESVHIGFAISLRQGGLVIPALLDADVKSLEEIRKEFVDLVMRAREGHLRSKEIGSSTVTITSLGERGADKVFGVIYPPQVALIGFGSLKNRPWPVGDAIGIRPSLSVILAGDHRATDGHTGSRFLESLNHQFQYPEELLP